MTERIPDTITRLLLVEGKEDQECFIQIGQHLGVAENWPLRIIQYGGISRLSSRIRTLANPDTMEQIVRIGIVRDADFNTDALQSVQDAIRNSNLRNDIELGIPQDTIVESEGTPSVSILILPSAEREGMLEDLVMDVLKNDPVTTCVNAYLDCLRESNMNLTQERLSKARLRAFITGKNVSDQAKGGDSDRLYLSDVFHMSWWKSEFWDHPAFDDAKAFLTQLLAN